MSTRGDGLHIGEDLEFQRREWRAQRAGWWALAGFVLAAVLGVFGDGPLSSTAASSPNGHLLVEYERFVRTGASSQIAIHVGSGAVRASGDLHLRVSRAYFDEVAVERIVPAPRSVTIGEHAVTLQFDATGAGPHTIVIAVEPREAGSHSARIESSRGGGVVISQFAYF